MAKITRNPLRVYSAPPVRCKETSITFDLLDVVVVFFFFTNRLLLDYSAGIAPEGTISKLHKKQKQKKK